MEILDLQYLLGHVTGMYEIENKIALPIGINHFE